MNRLIILVLFRIMYYISFDCLFVLQPVVCGLCCVCAFIHVFMIYPFRHTAVVISGTELARQLHREIQRDVEELVAQGNMRPHLGVVLVGDDPASRTYVKNKTRAASILGQIWALCAFLNTMHNKYHADQ